MTTVVLVIHLMIAVALVGVIMLQKSEGGALGMGGGGMSGFMTGRSAANLLTRTTAILAACFFATSIALALIASHERAGTPIIDTRTPPASSAPVLPAPAGNAPANTNQAPLKPSQLPAPQGPAAPLAK